ncbi:hypothetical protein DUI87_11768 [Hirundo rustica rustica]|uniref:Uncharacterized protein n=1 Tax=Hirundo rustica rustica TaxID=333673 RepID=A0A3M0KET2_HIRRU|nr:hypothetical protein DUI87_11768 [Hirundo rustica rustica]
MATTATCTRFTDEYQLYEELGKRGGDDRGGFTPGVRICLTLLLAESEVEFPVSEIYCAISNNSVGVDCGSSVPSGFKAELLEFLHSKEYRLPFGEEGALLAPEHESERWRKGGYSTPALGMIHPMS